jgi:solute carrier family 13 (sodium-dependent dicarboxylate transporter), member 2/3/5
MSDSLPDRVTAPVRLLLCLVLAAGAWSLAPAQPVGLGRGLALFVLVGSLWVTQALPLPVTALAVPLLAVVGGLLPARQALAPFAHPVIFLFLGGFALAAALRQQGLDRALVGAVLQFAGGRRALAILMLAGLTALLSMWMSNTATVALMLPLALGLLALEDTREDPDAAVRERAFVLLAMAYSASIGGMATLIGSPPNAIAAGQAGISFAQWLAFGGPLALLMWPLMLGVLALVLRPRLSGRITVSHEPLDWTRPRVVTAAVFTLAVAGWIFGAPLGAALGISADMDTVVALAAILALAAGGALDWSALERHVQWGVLLLFGGGLALGEVMSGSGASRFLAQGMLAWLQGAPLPLVVLGVVAFVVFLTELVSNTASAALLLPLLLPVAGAMGLPPVAMAAAIGIAASCAFMLPVATPPNAMVFGTGEVTSATMMRCGFWLNLLAIGLITGAALLAWR